MKNSTGLPKINFHCHFSQTLILVFVTYSKNIELIRQNDKSNSFELCKMHIRIYDFAEQLFKLSNWLDFDFIGDIAQIGHLLFVQYYLTFG